MDPLSILRNTARDAFSAFHEAFLGIREAPFKERRRLFAAWLRLKLRYLFLVKARGLKARDDRFLGFRVSMPDYAFFLSLYEEIFLRQPYRFTTAAAAPFIVDCGANMGMSILYFKRRYPNCRIIAFEPHKRTFEALAKNVEMNRLSNVELHNAAVSDQDGEIRLFSDPANTNLGMMTTHESVASRHWEAAKAVRLSGYLTRPIDLLKLDIEGTEDKVMEELAKAGKLALIGQLIMEYHHHMDPNSDRLSRMLARLEENGFGYQVRTYLKAPWVQREMQDVLIYAYRK